MRRLGVLVLAAIVVALPGTAGAVDRPAGAGGSGVSPGVSGPTGAAPATAAAGHLARLAPGLLGEVARAAPDSLLDVVLSLDHPADARLAGELRHLGVWSDAFRYVPAAAVRLPLRRLLDLERLPGIDALYDNHPLHYLDKESAELVDTYHAWNDLGVNGRGVTVAIIDTGVDGTHPDLAPAMKANVKLVGFGDETPTVPLENLPNSDTSSGHGTHVAGDVAGRGTMSHGEIKGLAYGADLVGIGTGDGLSVFTALEGYDWMLKNQKKYGIRVVNNSYGTGFGPFDPEDPINKATKRAFDAGITVVFANGNDGDEMSMNPYAAAPWVIPVAAGTKTGKVADFSSGGIEADTLGTSDFKHADIAGETRSPLHMGLYHPAVTTTGEDVVSTRANNTITPITALPTDARTLPPDELPWYHTLSGTSMASPETAGVVALVLQADPALTPAEVRMVLQSTARDIPGEPFWKQGYGYTDASAAVVFAESLKDMSPAATAQAVEQRQADRDRAVLATLDHPSHTYAWTDRSPFVTGHVSHTIDVPAGTERVKVLDNGGELPLVGMTTYTLTVSDAAGRKVGTASAHSASGTTTLDLNLRNLDKTADKSAADFAALRWGNWTVDVAALGTLVPPTDAGPVDDAASKRFMTTLVSIFPKEAAQCPGGGGFVPTGTASWRLQGGDKTPTVAPFPADPSFTYVGPVRGGALGNRTPERRLAGTFGEIESTATPPTFTTAPLVAPLVLGGTGEVDTYMQGPNDVASGVLTADLLDIAPNGVPTYLGSARSEKGPVARTAAPVETKAPISFGTPHTVGAGHRLALVLKMTFIGTSADTLFYDSDKYPSGLSVPTGQRKAVDGCDAGGDQTFSIGTTGPKAVPKPAPRGSGPAKAAPAPAGPAALIPGVASILAARPGSASPVPLEPAVRVVTGPASAATAVLGQILPLATRPAFP